MAASPAAGAGSPRPPTRLPDLELFHDCACPRARDCICRFYTDGASAVRVALVPLAHPSPASLNNP
jgi:hypothetical protein